MATKGERQALWFLTGVVVLGATVRLVRSRPDPVPASADARLDRQLAAVESAAVHQRTGASRRDRTPPSGRARASGAPQRNPAPSPEPAPFADPPRVVEKIDIDTASADGIARLPGIGPALAKRIVADRAKNGAFGCLAALDAVKGIGPAMLKRLDTLATFGGAPRTVCH